MTIKEYLNRMLEEDLVELIETNELDDGSIEEVYESKDATDGIMTIRVYVAIN